MRFTLFKFFLIISFLSLIPASIRSQADEKYLGVPVLRNYLPKEYKAHNQNWAIAEDSRGIMYFGNSGGLLEFDGYRWKLIAIPNSVVKSLAVDQSDNIFVGSADDFGYLKTGKDGTKSYISLLENLQDKAIGHVWHIYTLKDAVFFCTKSHIIRFRFPAGIGNKPEVTVWRPNSRFMVCYKADNRLFVQDKGFGLYTFEGEKLTFIRGSEIYARNMIVSVLPYDESGSKFLIADMVSGLKIYDGSSFAEFAPEAGKLLVRSKVYLPGAKLSDGSFAYGTALNGAVIISHGGKIRQIINTTTGLSDDGVLHVYARGRTLWLALENGIARVDYPSGINIYGRTAGLKGSVNDIKFYNGGLYIATTAGLFRLVNNQNNGYLPQFIKADPVNSQSWTLLTHKEDMLIAATTSLVIMRNRNYEVLDLPWRGIYTLCASVKNPGFIFAGLESGLGILRYREGRYELEGVIPDFSSTVRFIAEDDKGGLFLGTPFDGLFYVKQADWANPSSAVVNKVEMPLPPKQEFMVYMTGEGIAVTGGGRIFLKRKGSAGINEINYPPDFTGKIKIQSLYDNGNGEWWIAAVNENKSVSVGILTIRKNGTSDWKELSELKSAMDFQNENAVFMITAGNRKEEFWFGGADGVVSYNPSVNGLSFNNKSGYRAIIRSLAVNSDSVLFEGDDRDIQKTGIGRVEIDPGYNSIRIEFASNGFNDGLEEFQYMLEGFDRDWSQWTAEYRKDYTNLSPGEYRFRLRVKGPDERTGEESTLTFVVYPYLWQTIWAYLIYLLLFAGVIYLFVRYRVKYLEKKNLRLEQIIGERTKEISQQAEKLKEMDELKSRFFTNISHEFRTPLTLIMGQTENLISEANDGRIRQKLEMSYRNARRLLKLINQLLEISKIEAGKNTLTLSKVQIVPYLRQIFYNFESLAEQRGIELEFLQSVNSLTIFADKEKFEKIFNNLISNAVKFTPEGGKITLSIDENPGDAEKLQIRVKDTGAGIPENRIRYIFDRFYQVDRTQKSDIEGTGIGLALTRELTEIHEGTITASSKEGEGTEFLLEFRKGKSHFNREGIIYNYDEVHPGEDVMPLPAPEESGMEFQETSALPLNEITPDDDREVVLITDDNADIRAYIKETLEGDYIIAEADNGINGLESARKLIPDLIITDVMMPGMNGFEFSKEIKSDILTSHIPVIILTAKAEEEDKISGLDLGVDDYLTKPFSSRELKTRVRNLISIRKNLRKSFSNSSAFTAAEVSGNSYDQKFITGIMERINARLSDPDFSAEVLAAESGLSLSQLNRKLNALINQTSGKLIRTCRLEKAYRMLKSKEISIKEAAWETGFSDHSNFTRSFRSHFGFPPSDLGQKSENE